MGGTGSGRPGRRGGKTRAESCHRLAIADVIRPEPGTMDPAKLRRMLDRNHFDIEFDGISQRLLVTTTRQSGGGTRRWWVCLGCNRRCSVLYSPPRAADRRYKCLQCHRLCYSSQMVSAQTRWRMQATKLFARAGSDSDASYYERPKRMRWRRFHDLIDRAEAYENAAMELSFASNTWLRLIGSPSEANAREIARWARRPYGLTVEKAKSGNTYRKNG